MIYEVRGYSEDILVDDSTNSYQTAKDRILELEAENERLREALLDIKNGKDNPCYLVDEALRGDSSTKEEVK